MTGMGRIGYRAGQFFRTVVAKRLTAAEWEEITAVLQTQEAALFKKFPTSDQRHSYAVFDTLRSAGFEQPALLVAALLHDIGKICYPIWLWERVLIVLVKAFLPHKLADWGQGEASGWKRPFVIREQHPAWGAELAEEAGTTPLAIRLIRRHQDPLPQPLATEEDQLLAHLQWADDQN